MNADTTVAWERFARMRLEGRSDLIYRSYDLLTRQRMHPELLQLFKIAGVQHAEDESEYNTLLRLQRQFMNWGFGVQSIEYIKTLLEEYQAYRRCKDKNRAARWPYREPEEVQRLYAEHLAATERLSASGVPSLEPGAVPGLQQQQAVDTGTAG